MIKNVKHDVKTTKININRGKGQKWGGEVGKNEENVIKNKSEKWRKAQNDDKMAEWTANKQK